MNAQLPKPRITKNSRAVRTHTWSCRSSEAGRICTWITTGYGSTPTEAYENWANQMFQLDSYMPIWPSLIYKDQKPRSPKP